MSAARTVQSHIVSLPAVSEFLEALSCRIDRKSYTVILPLVSSILGKQTGRAK
jgi:hypothetical protein